MEMNHDSIKKMNILMISEGTIPSVLLCGKYQMEYLEKEGLINFRYSLIYWVSAKLLNWADTVIFIRPSFAFELYCIKELKKAGKKIIVVMDDDLLNVPSNVSSADHYKDKQGIMLEMFSLSDLFLSPSRNLLEKYGKLAENCAFIEEPSLEFSDNKKANDILKIGFAGSIDRTNDLNDILSDVIDRVVSKYPNRVTFEFFGAKPDFVEKYGFKHIPYQDSYEKYCETMASLNWDIGLAPMPITEFHRYKHYNKYIEYSAYGMVGIYTKCEPYIWAIRQNENGILCNNNADEWFCALVKLIEDDELREKIRNNCIEEAKTYYTIEAVSKQYYQYLQDVIDNEGTQTNEISSIFLKECAFFAERIIVKTKKYGWKTPIVVIRKISAGVFSNK